MKEKYRIVCYIRIEPDDGELFDTKEGAESEIDNLERMQPENRYEVEAVEQ